MKIYMRYHADLDGSAGALIMKEALKKLSPGLYIKEKPAKTLRPDEVIELAGKPRTTTS